MIPGEMRWFNSLGSLYQPSHLQTVLLLADLSSVLKLSKASHIGTLEMDDLYLQVEDQGKEWTV